MSIATRLAKLPATLVPVAWSAYSFPVALCIALRAWTLAAASVLWLAVPIAGASRAYHGMAVLDSADLGWLWAPWQRWDGVWYALIAARGYSAGDLSTAFFPLYASSMRWVSWLTGANLVAAGLFVSTAASGCAFILLYEWAREQFDPATARQALVALAVFPTAFFLLAPYSEALFLALTLLAWRAATRRAWLWSGLFAGLAALTRAQGILLVLPLGALYWSQYRAGVTPGRAAGALIIPPVAVGVFLLHLAQITGSLGRWLEIEGAWRSPALPWEPLLESVRMILSTGDPGIAAMNLLDLGLVLVFVALAGWSLRVGRLAEALYLTTLILPPLFTVARFDPQLPLASMGRFLVVGFPAFAVLGRLRLPGRIGLSFTLVSFVVQTLLLFLFTHWVFAG